MNDRFLTVSDVAELLKVAPTTVRNLIKSGDLRALQVGHRGEYRVESDMFEAYIKAQYDKQSALDASSPKVEEHEDATFGA